MSTTFPEVKSIQRDWLLIDAQDQVLGRMASRIAMILRGKHKPTFTPFLDTGDFVVVINAAKVATTGQKRSQKQYTRYSGYPGGLRSRTMEQIMEAHPDRIIRQAVKGMMPNGPLSRRMMGKLKIYPGASHPHGAQQPKPVNPMIMARPAQTGASAKAHG